MVDFNIEVVPFMKDFQKDFLFWSVREYIFTSLKSQLENPSQKIGITDQGNRGKKEKMGTEKLCSKLVNYPK